MKIFVDPEKAPLRGVNVALRQKAADRYLTEAAKLGIQLVGAGVDPDTNMGTIDLDISQMRGKSRQYRQQLLEFLEYSGAARVDLDAADILPLYDHDKHDAVSYAIAAQLNNGHQDLSYILNENAPDDVFNALHEAVDYVLGAGTKPYADADAEYMDAVHAEQAVQAGAIDRDLYETRDADPWHTPEPEPQAVAGWNDDAAPDWHDPFARRF